MQKLFNTLDRYIVREILVTVLAVLLVLQLVVMSVELAYWLAAVVEGRIDGADLLPVMSVSLVRYLVLLLPLSAMLTVMLVFGRLYRDSEMAAIMSAGCGPLCWYRPVLLIMLPLTLLLLGLTLFALPELNAWKQQLLDQASRQQSLESLQPGRFNRTADGKAVFFIESHRADGSRAEGVFMQQQDARFDIVTLADSASSVTDSQGERFLLLQNGKQYIGRPGSADYRIIEFEEYGIRLSPVVAGPVAHELKALPSAVLWSSGKRLQQAELIWRISVPLGMLMLVLLAVPLSYARPRSGRFARLALALAVYLVYSNLLGVSVNWIGEGVMPAWLAAVWVHGLALMLLLALFWQQGMLFLRRDVAGEASRVA